MNQQFYNKEDAALKEYVTLSDKFQVLISRVDDALKYIDGLHVIESKKDSLIIEVLGKRININFSMVFENPDTPLGQILAVLIKNAGTALESESILLSQWYDYLGNVKGKSISENSGLNIDQNNYLGTFAYMTIDKLLSSKEMIPYTNNS